MDEHTRQLADELRSMRSRVDELQQQQIQHSDLEKHLKRLTRNLTERVKELNCLYAISKLHEQAELSKDELLQKIVDLIPAAFQYPDITCVRLLLPDQQYSTGNYRQTAHQITSKIRVNQQDYGSLDVCYLDAVETEDTFLDEERALLETITERIGTILLRQLERQRMERQQEQLVQFDKLVALGTLVSGVAHEINNPNNFIMLNAPLLLDAWRSALPILDAYLEEHGDFLLGGLQFSEMRENIGQLFTGILEGSGRIKSIVDSLKGFARADTAELTPGVDINAVVTSAVKLLRNKIDRSTEHFAVSCEQNLPRITGNAQRLEQVILNLLQNACEALPDRQHKVELSTCYDQSEGCVVVTVRDEGMGISEDSMTSILDPFFTTKRGAGGTGLGLAVSASIIKHHQGTIQFESTVGKGTVAKIGLPLDEEEGR